MGFNIKLETLLSRTVESGQKDCRYEPELFPGLIFRMAKPKVVLLIFASGKIVLTGAKDREEIYDAYKRIKNLLAIHKNPAGNTN